MSQNDSQMDQVSKLPEHLPWIEGKDYQVIPNVDIPYGVPVRIRDKTGETFQINTELGKPQPIVEIPATDAATAKQQINDALKTIQTALDALK